MIKRVNIRSSLRILAGLLLITLPARGFAQKFDFAVHADPVISWMKSNKTDYQGEGLKTGLDLGVNVLHYLTGNIALSSGLSFITAGGRQSASDTHTMVFSNFTQTVPAGSEMNYSLRYLSLPAGVRFQTNQTGELTYYTDLGFDIRLLLKPTVDIPAMQINDENARKEVYLLNAGWHLGGGIEYELTDGVSIVAGVNYAQDFFDVTKDLEDVDQPDDRTRLKMIGVRLGLRF